MERLTKRIFNGKADSNIKLSDSPFFKMTNNLQKVITKLCEYEDLEEQGKLIVLPCKVGDRLYRIDTDENITDKTIEIFDIDNIVISTNGDILLKYDAYDGVICYMENIVLGTPYLDYYLVFTSEEDAKKKLEELVS